MLSILRPLNIWLKTALVGASASLAFAPFALGLDYIFAFEAWVPIASVPHFLERVLGEAEGLVLPVTLSWTAINAPKILQLNFQPTERQDPDKVSSKSQKADNPLFAALPKAIGTDIIYIASELHYLRVVTTEGDALILYSLQKAIADLQDILDGFQTHRSYWVAAPHIEKSVGKAPNRHILTKQGHLIPISRRQYRLIKDQLSTLPPS